MNIYRASPDHLQFRYVTRRCDESQYQDTRRTRRDNIYDVVNNTRHHPPYRIGAYSRRISRSFGRETETSGLNTITIVCLAGIRTLVVNIVRGACKNGHVRQKKKIRVAYRSAGLRERSAVQYKRFMLVARPLSPVFFFNSFFFDVRRLLLPLF